MFQIRVDDNGSVKLAGRLDAAEAAGAADALRAVRQSVKLDCSELDYISSAGIGVLIELYKRLQATGHTVTLVNPLPRVRSIFRYVGLDRLLHIE